MATSWYSAAMSSSKAELLLLASALSLAGCSDPVEPACYGPITLSVEPGAVPRFHWTGLCGITDLTVIRTGTNAIVWEIQATDKKNPIRDPVSYGQRPSNATTVAAAVALEAGVQYRLDVRAEVNNGQVAGTGTTFFTLQLVAGSGARGPISPP